MFVWLQRRSELYGLRNCPLLLQLIGPRLLNVQRSSYSLHWSSPGNHLFVLHHTFLFWLFAFSFLFPLSYPLFPLISFPALLSLSVFLFLHFPFVLNLFLPIYLITRNVDLYSLLASMKFQITFPHVFTFQSVYVWLLGYIRTSAKKQRDSGYSYNVTERSNSYTSYLFI